MVINDNYPQNQDFGSLCLELHYSIIYFRDLKFRECQFSSQLCALEHQQH